MSKSGSAAAQRVGRKAAVAPDETFSVGQWIQDVVELPYEKIQVDIECRHGQVRAINAAHRDSLVRDLKSNPPLIIELTTYFDQSVIPTSAFLTCLALNSRSAFFCCYPVCCNVQGTYVWGLFRNWESKKICQFPFSLLLLSARVQGSTSSWTASTSFRRPS